MQIRHVQGQTLALAPTPLPRAVGRPRVLELKSVLKRPGQGMSQNLRERAPRLQEQQALRERGPRGPAEQAGAEAGPQRRPELGGGAGAEAGPSPAGRVVSRAGAGRRARTACRVP